MTIKIPKHLKAEFLNFLDLAQSSITEEEIAVMSKDEQDCLKFVQEILGGQASARFETRKQQRDAAKAFSAILQ